MQAWGVSLTTGAIELIEAFNEDQTHMYTPTHTAVLIQSPLRHWCHSPALPWMWGPLPWRINVTDREA